MNWWTTSYFLMYSSDGIYWNLYEEDDNDGVLPGSMDATGVWIHDLQFPIVARYIRLHPYTWVGYPALRVEMYGCILEDYVPPAFGNFTVFDVSDIEAFVNVTVDEDSTLRWIASPSSVPSPLQSQLLVYKDGFGNRR